MKWSTFYTITGCSASLIATLIASCMPNPYAISLYLIEAGVLVGSMLMISHRDIDSVVSW